MKVDEMLSFMVPMNGSRIFCQNRLFRRPVFPRPGAALARPSANVRFLANGQEVRRPESATCSWQKLIIPGANVRTETEAGSFDLRPIDGICRALRTPDGEKGRLDFPQTHRAPFWQDLRQIFMPALARKAAMALERVLRWTLVSIAIAGLVLGIAARANGRAEVADLCFTFATVPVIAGLAVSIVRDLLAGRLGVDAIALVSMSAAVALRQPLAGAVVALMYSGGNVLEDIAVSRAEHDLRALVDRAPRQAHRRTGDHIVDVPIADVSVGDKLMVRAGEIVAVDGVVTSLTATVDESALTGEPIPVTRSRGGAVLSGSLNAGEAFEMEVTAAAGESTYAGIVKMVTAAQTAKAPFVRLADRYALIFLPVTLAIAALAFLISGDLTRSLAVLVAATPCPLILAAPVAFIAGVAQAARLGILVKGGGPLEALARAHTVLFDKTGTLTIGGARLLSIEAAPGEQAEQVLSF